MLSWVELEVAAQLFLLSSRNKHYANHSAAAGAATGFVGVGGFFCVFVCLLRFGCLTMGWLGLTGLQCPRCHRSLLILVFSVEHQWGYWASTRTLQSHVRASFSWVNVGLMSNISCLRLITSCLRPISQTSVCPLDEVQEASAPLQRLRPPSLLHRVRCSPVRRGVHLDNCVRMNEEQACAFTS